MLLYEHQAQLLLQRYSIPFLPTYSITSEDQIDSILEKTEIEQGAVQAEADISPHKKLRKSYIGGIEKTMREKIQAVFLENLIDPDTQEEFPISRVFLSHHIDIDTRFFLSLSVDRVSGFHVLMLASIDTMTIEELRHTRPLHIHKEIIPEKKCLHAYQMKRIMKRLHIDRVQQLPFSKIIDNLIEAYFYYDISLLEINPLVITAQKSFFVMNIHMEVDENAFFRQKEIAHLTHYLKKENVLLDNKSKIGIIANGKALTYASLDSLYFWGAILAPYIDIGDSITPEKIVKALDLLHSHSALKVIYIHLFFGNGECHTVIQTMIEWIEDRRKRVGSLLHIIIYMEGTLCSKVQREFEESCRSSLKNFPLHLFSSIEESARSIFFYI